MNNNSFELQVLVNGKPVKETSFREKSFIEARRGTQYTIRLKNNGCRRALAIFSVDGVDTLKGQVAEESSSGYVINAYSSIEIKGFRVDDDNVSAFKFDDKEKSYANRVGGKTNSGGKEKTTKNSGVIGVKITLEEKAVVSVAPNNQQIPYYPYPINSPWIYPAKPFNPWWETPPWTCYGSSVSSTLLDISTEEVNSSTNYQCSVGNNTRELLNSPGAFRSSKCLRSTEQTPQSPDFSLGTTWGEKIKDEVQKVDFKTSDEVFFLSIYYGERHELEKFGVDFSPKKRVSSGNNWPKPFGESEYCDIPDYR